jgi:hypothetical protein
MELGSKLGNKYNRHDRSRLAFLSKTPDDPSEKD